MLISDKVLLDIVKCLYLIDLTHLGDNKGQIISKAICVFLTSPKKRTKKFDLILL